MRARQARQWPSSCALTQSLRSRRCPRRERRIQTMTSLRWENVPKRRVERPPLLAPDTKTGRRKQKPPSFRDRIEDVGGTRPERPELSRPASAADYAYSAKRRSGRCSACKAHGVTLWRVEGLLVCATCRAASQVADTPKSGHRQERDLPKLPEGREL